ncbi:myosin-15-like [Durio zibethinus]|uniref:Myosin-15-like n=1 Tax=Durio zibethinus TaxID=66656 RepID=A0A6P6BF24_DURZI|nr:myosin-15-like [Durio zibethinus]XP_022775731.1 myosin-15-like [Durio zibethinus]
MGEIDTKPIEPVQVARSLFGGKGDQLKHLSSSSDSDVEKEKDIESLEKELANYRLQMEAKDREYMQALLQLEHYKKTTEEFSVLLHNSELERDRYIEECNEVKNRIDELESKMKGMVHQLSETAMIREQLSHVLNELKVTQADLLTMETELAAAKDSELKAMTQVQLMETSANMEKEKSEEPLGRILELHDAVLISKVTATEAEKEKCRIVFEKGAELESLKATSFQAQELIDLRKQLETKEELENQLLTKSAYIDSLQAKLEQVTNILGSIENATSDGEIDLNQIEQDLAFKERKISDQAFYIEALETELNRLTHELKNAKEVAWNLNRTVGALKSDLEKLEIEMDEVRERENDAQVEISMLKSELHEGRSKIAAAETAEARAQSFKSGLYLAVQQLAVEAEEAKKENQKLKQEVEAEESDNSTFNHQDENEKSSQGALDSDIDDQRDKCVDSITISIEEYNSLIRKAEKADQISKSLEEDSKQLTTESENKNEVELLKKELEVAMAKIGLFRNRAEQAATRAEAAEKAKATMEDQLRMWQEQKHRRKAALAALREESTPRQFSPPTMEKLPEKNQPLGKVLNLKF